MLHILKFNNKNRKTKIKRIDSRLANLMTSSGKYVNLKMAWGQYKKNGHVTLQVQKAQRLSLFAQVPVSKIVVEKIENGVN
jgi:hypothetical protein